MQPSHQPPSKVRILLTWVIVIGMIVAMGLIALFRLGEHLENPEPDSSRFVSIVRLVVGTFFIIAGLTGYFICLLTCCFTFDFSRPVWNTLKQKQFVANILVSLGISMGVGFAASIFLGPFLRTLSMEPGMADMAPVLGCVILFNIGQIWFLIWGPLEKRLIQKRMLAFGIHAEQLRSAFFIGLSNPSSGRLKRFAAIEEDMGALWITPEQLIYYGDSERFALTRDQILAIERKADTRSTSILAGITHVILRVRASGTPDREIRLHNEGLLTMSGKRRAMNHLAEAIYSWHAAPTAVPA